MNNQHDPYKTFRAFSIQPDQTLVRPLEYRDKECVPLSEQETQKFHRLLDILANAYERSQLTILYRGEKKHKLRRKLCGSKHHPATSNLFFRLFYFGEKAKFYFNHNNESLRDRDHLQHINDVSYHTFYFVFRQLYYIMNDYSQVKKRFFSKRKQRTVTNFAKNNVELANFFLNGDNLPRFYEAVEKLNVRQKEQVRDYYLYLLHTFGQDGISKLSFFVSSSEDIVQAKKFALSWDQKERKSIVMTYFVPEPFFQYGLNSSILHNYQSFCSCVGLPPYASTFYPKQKEFAIKGSMFPHFILGAHDLERNYFIVNYHIFQQPEHLLDSVPTDGLIIGQENFEEMMDSTGYAGYVERVGLVYSDVLYRSDKFKRFLKP